MNVVDPRTRNKVVLEGGTGPSRRSDFGQIVASNILFLLAFYVGRACLSDADVLWTVVRILGVGAGVGFIWGMSRGRWLSGKPVEWPVVGLASLLLSLRLCATLFVLTRLPLLRAVIITRFSPIWMQRVLNNASSPPTFIIFAAIVLSFLSDSLFSVENFRTTAPGYVALVVEVVASSVFDHTQGVLLPVLGPSTANLLTVVGAFVLSFFAYVSTRFLPNATSSESATGFIAQTFAILLLASAMLYISPIWSKKLVFAASSHEATVSYVAIVASATVFSVLPFFPTISRIDILVACCLYYGISRGEPRQSVSQSPYSSITQVVRGYLKSILSNPESRKIFYFLVLNMCYMLVQMLYGIWTNSLGLISDAIHMAFDCMAIGVGLIASVMARWSPNERFTYGYGRIETLSGFSNGVFLILISIFIVFEAIERLMNPPEMNTSQLLLVSTLGLAVNLFGMFAMGGHHHHGGHSHSHGHSHGHSHESSPPQPASHSHEHRGHSHGGDQLLASTSHRRSHDHDHDHADGHGHGHSHFHLHVDTGREKPSHSHHSHSSSADGGNDHSVVEVCSDNNEKMNEEPQLLRSLPLGVETPITPNYDFEYDAHYEHHHAGSHGPNLHDHNHDSTHEGHSHNMRGVFLHVMADTLGSVGVIISTLLIQFYGWTGFDPIASLFIAILIAASVIPLVIDTGKVLMLDSDHRTAGVERALTELHQVDGVASYSSPRFWPKDDANVVGSIHISVTPSASGYDPSGPHSMVQGHYQQVDRIVERVDTLLRSRIPGLEELTIQVEGAAR